MSAIVLSTPKVLGRQDDAEVDHGEDRLQELDPEAEQQVFADHPDADRAEPDDEDHQRGDGEQERLEDGQPGNHLNLPGRSHPKTSHTTLGAV
ncbi:hypothetical protein [Thiocapsa rosea]|uniref:hypothetical protein n=1 Tax=Thiocapsa rosea TaxID=69360 RepID=UPI0011C3E628|nr:hypothetical protein [Thiocapsa rosea]